jgi:hypothetical protein
MWSVARAARSRSRRPPAPRSDEPAVGSRRPAAPTLTYQRSLVVPERRPSLTYPLSTPAAPAPIVFGMRTRVLAVLASYLIAGTLAAQGAPSSRFVQFIVSSGERGHPPVAEANVSLPESGETAITDSSGVASLAALIGESVRIRIRKVGFEAIDTVVPIPPGTPTITIRAQMSTVGTVLPTITVTGAYPREPWREGFELRRKQIGTAARDTSRFKGGVPANMDRWFEGIPGVYYRSVGSSDGLRMSRCRRPAVFVNGQSMTRGVLNSASDALRSIPASEVVAIEVYMNQVPTPPQFAQPLADCSIVIWLRL